MTPTHSLCTSFSGDQTVSYIIFLVDNNFIIIVELNKFIEVLDKRVEKTTKETPGLVAKKERKEGEPSSSVPPNGAPKWAVKQACGADTEMDITNETQTGK